jgi:phosphate transport system substrate-binding protein
MPGRARLLFPVLLAAISGCSGAAEEPAPTSCDRTRAVQSANEIRVAGSGANLAPIAAVAELFEKRHEGQRVRVAQSIGTGGAIRALLDRAIEVGLASRLLTPEEKARGIETHPLARVALAPTVHEHVRRTAITKAELTAIYLGEMRLWADGTAIVPILRQPGDSAMRAIEDSSPDLEAAMHAARESGRALTRYTDQEVRDTLLAVPGAIGFLDAGTVALEEVPLHSLELDGIPPTAEAVRDGRYPFALTLSLLVRSDASDTVRAFLALATSTEVAELLASVDYDPATPLPPGGP